MSVKKKETVKGKVFHMRNNRDECVCCDGKHIYGTGVDFENNKNISDFLWEFIYQDKNYFENKTVRVIVEVIDD